MELARFNNRTKNQILKLGASFAIMCLLLVTYGGSASAATGGTDRPLRCRETVTLVFNLATHALDGTGEDLCSHLGRTTVEIHGTFGGTSAQFEAIFTAANGDQLFIDATSQATAISPTELQFINDDTFVGGTGRFASARGSGHTVGIGVVDPTNPFVYTVQSTFVAAISY
jgi:hypothetical protein